MVTASDDSTAAVWSVKTGNRLTVLKSGGRHVRCCAASTKFVVGGTSGPAGGGGLIRIYTNGDSYSLVRVLEGLRQRALGSLTLIVGDLLMTSALDKTLAFIPLPSGKPDARRDAGSLFCRRR